MKKTAKKILLGIMLLAVVMCFCGCDLFTVDSEELLSPPAPQGDLYDISEALKKTVPETYVLKYPSRGEHRSAIATEDIDGDGVTEAFAFYSTVSGDTINMSVNFIKKKDGKWKSIGETSLEAGGIERVDFCDLDGDGTKELLAGWEIYGTSEKQVGIYSVKGDTITELFIKQYTNFICADMNGDGTNELFLQLLDAKEKSNRAEVYSVNTNGGTVISSSIMDATVKSANDPVVSKLTNGQTAVFVDEIKGLGAITEVLLMREGELLNPLLDSSKLENTVTLRGSNILSKDVNNDKMTEIPTAAPTPIMSEGGEKVYYTNWCSFDGETLNVEKTAITNTSDNYEIEIPAKFVGALAVKKDLQNAEQTFYYYSAETETAGDMLFKIKVYSKKDFEKRKEKEMFNIRTTDTSVFAGQVNENASPISFKAEEIKKMFNIINTSK